MVWDPTGDGKTSLRAAWGIFYDALAGQGDFFQNGVLAPPFTPLLEVNSPPAAADARATRWPRSAAAPVDFPPGLIFIGWGTDFQTPYAQHFNLTAAADRRDISAPRSATSDRAASTCRSSWRSTRALYVPGQTTPGRAALPGVRLVRPTFSVARLVVRLAAGERCGCGRRTGINFLASYTLGHAIDHVSGLNIGGEPRPVLPVTIGDQASIDAALAYEKGDALFDVAPPLRPQLRRRAADARRILAPSAEHVVGGWQVNGIVQAQTGFPAGVYRSDHRHPLPDQPARM